MKEKLSLLLLLSSVSFGEGLIVADRMSFIGQVKDFAEVSNPNGNASAVDLFPIPLVPVQPVLYVSSSILTFEGVSGRDTTTGFDFGSSIYPLAQPKVSFSGGSIRINHITSTQGDAYGAKAMGKAIFELYHGLFAFVDASVRFGAISANRNAYGLQSKQEIELRGSGSFNRGEMSFDGGIVAGNDVYGISSPIFKLTGTNLAFKSKLEAGNNAYGIQTQQELLIQESKTSFAPLNAKIGDAYGMWIQGANNNIQNSEMSDEVTSVTFASITAGKDAYAIRSQGNISIRNADIHFGSVQGQTNAYGLYNEGTTFTLSENFFNHFGGVMRFNSVSSQGESAGIYNAGGNNQIAIQKASIEFGTIQGKQQSYGIKILPSANLTFSINSDTMRPICGFSLQFNHILSQGDAYGLYTQGTTKIDLPSFSTLNFGLIEGKNAYGIYANNAPVEIFLTDSTLALSLKGANQKAFMQSGSGKIDLTLSKNSRILIDGDGGTLNTLSIRREWEWEWGNAHPIIDLSGNHSKREKARTLEITHYSNSDRKYSTNTVFNLFYSRQNSYADKLTISQANAEDRIRLDLYVLPSDLKPSSQSQKMIVADVDSKITINGIKANGEEGKSSIDQGFETYTTKLYREDYGLRSRYFIKTNDPSTVSLSSLSLVSLGNLFNQYNLHFYNLGQVSKRLGMIRRGHESGGVWGRMSAGRAGGGLTALSAFNIELGGDYGLKDHKKGLDFYVGGHFAYTASYSNALNDDPSALELGIYGSVMSDVGWYYYAQVKGEYIQNQVSNPTIESFQINQGIMTLSQELGYRLDFGQEGGFYIEPKTNLDLSISLPTSYRQKHLETSMILDTQIQPSVFLNGKLGGDIGYSFINSKNFKTDLYLGLNYDYIFLAKPKIKVQTTNIATTLDSNGGFYQGFSLVLGTHIQVNQHIKLTMDLDWGAGSFFGLIKGSFGFKYNF